MDSILVVCSAGALTSAAVEANAGVQGRQKQICVGGAQSSRSTFWKKKGTLWAYVSLQ